MRTTLLILLLLPITFSFSFSFKEITSFGLDHIPFVGYFKRTKEAYDRKNLIKTKISSIFKGGLSLLGEIPGINYFTNSKDLKNGKKFSKAAQRAEKAGKKKNADSFRKASARAMAKAEKNPRIVQSIFKVVSGFFF